MLPVFEQLPQLDELFLIRMPLILCLKYFSLMALIRSDTLDSWSLPISLDIRVLIVWALSTSDRCSLRSSVKTCPMSFPAEVDLSDLRILKT